MITDSQTNTVYFSNLWSEENPEGFAELQHIIQQAGYTGKLLIATTDEDYNCRDYMPVQVAKDDFVQFVFRPVDYYNKGQIWEITNPVVVNAVNKLPLPRFSRLILDGGNIAKAGNKVIVTDKIIADNRYQFGSDEAVIAELERDLRCKVIVIPAYPNEETGHADGLIRFVDDNTVLLNNTKQEPEQEWLKQVLAILKAHNLAHHDIPCTVEMDQGNAIGLYINYLHVGNLVVVPQFDQKEDAKALKVMNKLFGHSHQVVPYNASWIAEFGGVLNCASWTVCE